jgi:hypothetical protein
MTSNGIQSDDRNTSVVPPFVSFPKLDVRVFGTIHDDGYQCPENENVYGNSLTKESIQCHVLGYKGETT